jgi:hypothetical protein
VLCSLSEVESDAEMIDAGTALLRVNAVPSSIGGVIDGPLGDWVDGVCAVMAFGLRPAAKGDLGRPLGAATEMIPVVCIDLPSHGIRDGPALSKRKPSMRNRLCGVY